MKKKNIFLIILIILLVLAIAGSATYIVIKTINENAARDEYSKLASSYATQPELTSPSIDETLAENPIDFESLTKQNSDIYAWIYIPDTNINYPICIRRDNDNYYIDHDIYENYSYAGAIYSQTCNSWNFSDPVTVLYGHNMADGSMFANLHKFEGKDFFDEHKYFYIYTYDRKLTYEVVSAFNYDDRHIINSFDFSRDSVFQDYLDTILNPHSLMVNVRDGVSLNTDDKIVTLSTCLNSGNGRYLVQGVLHSDEPTK